MNRPGEQPPDSIFQQDSLGASSAFGGMTPPSATESQPRMTSEQLRQYLERQRMAQPQPAASFGTNGSVDAMSQILTGNMQYQTPPQHPAYGVRPAPTGTYMAGVRPSNFHTPPQSQQGDGSAPKAGDLYSNLQDGNLSTEESSGGLKQTLRHAREVLWSGGTKRKVLSAFGAMLAVSSVTMDVADKDVADAVAFVADKSGFGPGETVIYTETDCLKPLFYTDIDSRSNLLVKKILFADLEQREKLQADKNYKPVLYEGFLEDTLRAQYVAELPKTPFTTEAPGEPRLRTTRYAGKLGFALCFTDEVGKVIEPIGNDGSRVKVYLDKIKINAIDTDINTGYENVPLDPKHPSVSADVYPDGEIERENKTLMPDPKDPKNIYNPKILAQIKLDSLAVFNTGQTCDGWLTNELTNTLETILSNKAGKEVHIEPVNGPVLPKKAFEESVEGKEAASTDFKLINPNTSTAVPACTAFNAEQAKTKGNS